MFSYEGGLVVVDLGTQFEMAVDIFHYGIDEKCLTFGSTRDQVRAGVGDTVK